MKRGLVSLDPAEVADREWSARLEALRDRLRRDRLGAALLYGDVQRSDDIAYLTNLCIYWNEGVLAVPADGEPAFLTKLSKRVHPWMRRTSVLRDLRSGPNLAGQVAGFLAEQDAAGGAVGVVDAGWWPAMLLEEVSDEASGWELRPLDDAVRAARQLPSAAEVALLERAGRVLAEAAEAAVAEGLDDARRMALVEQVVRGAGFKDLRVGVQRTPDAVCVDAVGEYRNGWLRAARAGGAAADRLQAALSAAAAGLAPGVRPSALPGGDEVEVRCVDAADLSTGGSLRACSDADRPIPDGAAVALSAEATGPGGPLAVADTYLVRAGGAVRLTERSADAGLG